MKPGISARRGVTVKALVGAVLFLVLLAGCGPVTPQQAAQARAATSGPVGPLTFQLPAQPSGFDPFAGEGTADQLLAAAQFEPLVSAVEGRIMPRMADWWAMIHDDRTLVLTIKHDQWSDGVRMGADDLLFTVEAHLQPGSTSPLLPALLRIRGAQEFHAGQAEHVSGIIAETSRTAVISLLEPDPSFLAQLTGVLVLPRHTYEGEDLRNPATFREPEVGSGAYLFDSWQGSDQVTLKPNPQVKPHTRLETVVARVVSPDQVVPALERGDLDVALHIPPGQLDRVPAGYNIIAAPGDRVIGLSGRGPLADVRVRQAVAYAIDREGILETEMGGHGRVVDSILFTPDWAVSPERVRRAHDPAAARALLVEAGLENGAAIRLVALTDDADRAVWDAVVADLEEVGLNATIEIRPVTDHARVWADPAVDGVIETYWMPVADPVHVQHWVQCGVPSGFCDPRLDALLDRGRSELATLERQDIYRQADRVLSQELPVVPLWVPDAAVVVVAGRAGVSPLLQPATAMIDYWGPALTSE